MPTWINCSNTFCRGYTDRLGGLCSECQAKADAQKKQSWKWRGWSRQEERAEQMEHKQPKGKGK